MTQQQVDALIEFVNLTSAAAAESAVMRGPDFDDPKMLAIAEANLRALLTDQGGDDD